MGLMSALDISSAALGVHQAGISIVSNNISNMNTDGYSKQKANLGTLTLGLPIGNNVASQVKTSAGVEIINVQRYTTSFIGSYYRDQVTEQSYLNQKSDAMNDIASMFDELEGRGLDSALTSFYEALDNLNQYPSDMAARVNFLDAASSLTDSMNGLSTNLNKLKNQSLGDGETLDSLKNSEIYSSMQSINTNLESLAKINKMLISSQTGTLENNNLLDRRDSILNNLAQYGDFDVDIMDNGSVNLSLDGTKLVSGIKVTGTFDVQTAADYDAYCQENRIDNTNTCNAVVMIKKSDGTVIQNANDKMDSGSIGAMIDTATSEEGVNANTILKNLDTLAQSIADVFNDLQTRDGAFYLDNAGGTVQLSNANLADYTIFKTNDGTDTITAANISINSLLKEDGGYNKIAAAYFENYDPADPTTFNLDAVGNANNIIAMINTKTNNTDTGFDNIGNISFGDYYNGVLSKVTSATTSAQNASDAQDDVVSALDTKASSETSVDLNEELTDLVKFQTAYSASARVFSTCNSILDILVSLGT